MLSMMMPGVPSMYGVPDMSTGGGAATMLIGAGLPPVSSAVCVRQLQGATQPPAGGMPGMMPYSVMMPVLLRGAMPPAGIVQQVPHWPMITQGTSGEQSNPTAAGTPPGAVQVTAGGASAAVGQAAVRFASGGFVVMAHRV